MRRRLMQQGVTSTFRPAAGSVSNAVRPKHFLTRYQDRSMVAPPSLHVHLSNEGQRYTTSTVDLCAEDRPVLASAYILVDEATCTSTTRRTAPAGVVRLGPPAELGANTAAIVLPSSTRYLRTPESVAQAVKALQADLAEHHVAADGVLRLIVPLCTSPMLRSASQGAPDGAGSLLSQCLELFPKAQILAAEDTVRKLTTSAAVEEHQEEVARTIQRLRDHPRWASAEGGSSTMHKLLDEVAVEVETFRSPCLDRDRFAPSALRVGDSVSLTPTRALDVALVAPNGALTLSDRSTGSLYVDAACGVLLPYMKLWAAHFAPDAPMGARYPHLLADGPSLLGFEPAGSPPDRLTMEGTLERQLAFHQALRRIDGSRIYTAAFGMVDDARDFLDDHVRQLSLVARNAIIASRTIPKRGTATRAALRQSFSAAKEATQHHVIGACPEGNDVLREAFEEVSYRGSRLLPLLTVVEAIPLREKYGGVPVLQIQDPDAGKDEHLHSIDDIVRALKQRGVRPSSLQKFYELQMDGPKLIRTRQDVLTRLLGITVPREREIVRQFQLDQRNAHRTVVGERWKAPDDQQPSSGSDGPSSTMNHP